VIDEWQDVCRRMLTDRKNLTSNTVLGRALGDRNLIDDDLFVDLALVKPKRSENEKRVQDIDPEKGSDLFTWQEVEKRFAYQDFLQEVISQRNDKNIAIIGEPGAGKTTLLQKLAFWLLQATDDLVIWVDLAGLGNQSLGDYLEEKWLKEALGKSREEIKADWQQKFKSGGFWLLLDGLDEMSQTDQQSLNFRGLPIDPQIVITCRLNLWQANPSRLQGFQTYLTQPFQDEQMNKFIQQWFQNFPGKKSAEVLVQSLWSELETPGKERIKDLCRNPLRLTLLVSIWHKRAGELPDIMAKLYERFVEYIYQWKHKEFVVKDGERKQLDRKLGELAKASLDGTGKRFRLSYRLVCEYLGKPNSYSLLDKALTLGWLNEVGIDADEPEYPVYGFYHATFQEYFAALAVEDWDYFLPEDHVDFPVEGKRYRIFEPQWKQVILLWLGREDIKDEEKELFIGRLVEFNDGVEDLYGYHSYFLAAAGINEFKACSLGSEIVRQIVKGAFGYFNIEKQEWRIFLQPIEEGARKAIPETIRQLAITELSEIIENCPEEDTKMEAAESLGKIDKDNPVAINALVELIGNTTGYKSTKWRATESLGKIGKDNPVAINALVELIGNTTGYKSTWQTFETLTLVIDLDCLGEIDKDNPVAIAALVKLIRTTQDESIMLEVKSSRLWKIEKDDPLAIYALVKLIRTTQDESIQQQAAKNLGQIGQNNPVTIAALVQLIDTTQDESIQRQIAESLGEIDKYNSVKINTLVELIRTNQDESIQQQAAESLGQIGKDNPVAINALVELIHNTQDESIQRQVAQSLGQIGKDNPVAINALVELIHNTTNEDIKFWAADSLLVIDKEDNPVAINALVKLIRTTQKYIQWNTLQMLGEIGKDNLVVIATLVELIRTTQDESIQCLAANSLGKIDKDNPVAINALVELIHNTADEFTKRRVAESLIEILTESQQMLGVVSALKDYLSDEVYQNDFDRFNECYKVIWNCAKNLPYPEFYQAWHHPSTTPHTKSGYLRLLTKS
jgi:HEAT repeat protein